MAASNTLKAAFLTSTITIFSAQSFAAETIQVRAIYAGKTAWQISAILKDKGACKLSTRKQPELAACQRISFYALQTFSEFFDPDKPEPDSSQSPRYEFIYKNKVLPVEYKLAEECNRMNDGTLKCKTNELTPAQKLLIELKAYAPMTKF